MRCYACLESRVDWLKQCSHCGQWSCGKHAEQHIYLGPGSFSREEIICHLCEVQGHMAAPPVDAALEHFLSHHHASGRARKVQKKSQAKQQKAARKKKS